MLAAYVGLSRAKLKETVLITQPFSPALFAHGPPPGPHILMRLLRGEISADSVDVEFERLQRDATESSAEKDVMRMHWQCRLCFLQGREDHTKSMEGFGVRCPADFVSQLLVQGAWARCGQCAAAARAERLSAYNLRLQAEASSSHKCQACGEELEKDRFWPVDWRSHRTRGISCKECQVTPQSARVVVPLASAAVHRCHNCTQEKRRCEFWPVDWGHRHQNISCKGCQPAEPSLRGSGQGCLPQALHQHNEAVQANAAGRVFPCRGCREEKTRDAFWPSDFNNRYLYALHCKVCRPTPPSERPRGKHQKRKSREA